MAGDGLEEAVGDCLVVGCGLSDAAALEETGDESLLEETTGDSPPGEESPLEDTSTGFTAAGSCEAVCVG